MRLLLIATLLICSLGLHAGFEGTIKGSISDSDGNPLSGVEIKAEVDNWWGFETEDAVEDYKERAGPLVTLEGAGTASSNESGEFTLTMQIRTSGEGRLPKGPVLIDDEIQTFEYAAVTLNISMSGYRSVEHRGRAYRGGEGKSQQIPMAREYSYEATLVHLADRRAAADVRVSVIAWDENPNKNSEKHSFEVSTDKEGVLRLDDAKCAGNMRLRMVEPGLAFAETSRAWEKIKLSEGYNDGGSLVVVPGGSVQFEPVHAYTGEPVKVRPTLIEVRPPDARLGVFKEAFEATREEIVATGLPVGTYNLWMRVPTGGFWRGVYVHEFEVKTGKLTELGQIRMEPLRSLAVRAVDDEGVEITEYEVTVEQLDGPQTTAFRRNQTGQESSGFWTESARFTPDKNVFTRLTSGDWRVTVHAEEFLPTVLEVTLPGSETIDAKLLRGGKVKLTVQHNGRSDRFRGRAYLVPVSAPIFEEVRDCTSAQVFARFEQGLDMTGIVECKFSEWRNNATHSAIKPGKYTLFAGYGAGGGYRVDDVVVRKGETTDVVLTDSPSSVTIVLMSEGRPKANSLVYLVPNVHPGFREDELETLSARTNADGSVMFESVPPAGYTIMTGRERDWIEKGGKRGHLMNRKLPYESDRQLGLGFGDRVKLEVEACHAGYVWLSVAVIPPEGVTLSRARLVDQELMWDYVDALESRAEDGVFDFGPLRRSTYEFVVPLQAKDNDSGILMRIIELDEEREKRIEIVPELATISVTVNPPRGIEMSRVVVTLSHESAEPWRIQSGTGKDGRPDENGDVEFTGVPVGSYRVYAWIMRKRDNRFVEAVASESLDVTGPSRTTVTFNERAGDIKLTFENDMLSLYDGDQIKYIQVQLLDESGRQAEMGDPAAEYHIQSRDVHIMSVNEGRYTLRVNCEGYETYEQENVTIRPGGTTTIQVRLKRKS